MSVNKKAQNRDITHFLNKTARKKFTQTLFPSSYVFASLYTLYTNILVIIFILDILDAKLVHQVYLINLYNPEFSELKIFT